MPEMVSPERPGSCGWSTACCQPAASAARRQYHLRPKIHAAALHASAVPVRNWGRLHRVDPFTPALNVFNLLTGIPAISANCEISTGLSRRTRARARLSSAVGSLTPYRLLFLSISLRASIFCTYILVSCGNDSDQKSVGLPRDLFALIAFITRPSPLLYAATVNNQSPSNILFRRCIMFNAAVVEATISRRAS